MCGIAGEICPRGGISRPAGFYGPILSSMARRGPDQEGLFQGECCALLHRRLSVIDPSGGIQPMTAGPYTMVYNGELYNTAEVRSLLLKKGMSFETTSDTEVLLKAFAVFGEKCVNMLNGIFAFAVWNEKAKRLFMARDRMGVKPFFYHLSGGRLVFSSEIKSLFEHPEINPAIDLKGISELLLIAPGRTPGYGVFKGIKELKQGYMAHFDKHGFREKKYWEVSAKKHTDTFEETVEKVRFLVTDSIERQLVSDVPVGTFLSGGLDSSLISSVASRYMKKRGERLKTFSITYRDNEKYFEKSRFQPNSDEVYIKEMSEYLDSDHTMVVIDTPELANALFPIAMLSAADTGIINDKNISEHKIIEIIFFIDNPPFRFILFE